MCACHRTSIFISMIRSLESGLEVQCFDQSQKLAIISMLNPSFP